MSTIPTLPKWLWKVIQRGLASMHLYDAKIDGIPGTKTQLGLEASEHAELNGGAGVAPVPVSKPSAPQGEVFDSRSEANIKTLHPIVQPKAREFLIKANAAMYPRGVVAKIISGTRTFEEQDALYKQAKDGRDNDGDGRVDESDEMVTKAPGGFSNHNFGVAFDVGLFKGSDYLEDSPLYSVLGPIGKSIGFNWGGDWKSIVDLPHYEWPTGLTMAQMRDRVNSGKSVL